MSITDTVLFSSPVLRLRYYEWRLEVYQEAIQHKKYTRYIWRLFMSN